MALFKKRELDELTRRRLKRAVETIEASSGVELVIAVRPQADSYRHVELLLGLLLSYAALLYMLFAPPVFGLVWIAGVVAGSVGLGVAIAWAAPGLKRLLVGRARVTRRVLEAARATFVERGVSRTRARTGVLLYVAQLERRCVLVPDVGVQASVPEAAWRELARRVESLRLPRRFNAAAAEQLAAVVEAARETFEQHIPRSADDINELEDVA